MHYKRDFSLPPTFRAITPLGIPQLMQPKGRPNTRFQTSISNPQLITRDFINKKTLLIPSEMLEDDGIKYSLDWKRQKQLKMILETITINRLDCWIWAGAASGGYPVISYFKQRKGVMKVLVGWITGADLDYVETRKFCKTPFCINPAHYHFENFPYNIPKDGDLLKNIYGMIVEDGEERKFWRTNEVYPWFPLNSQERPLEAITEELKQKLIQERRSLAFLEQKRLVENAIDMKPTDDFRTFFKITPSNSSGEATNNAENGIEENS